MTRKATQQAFPVEFVSELWGNQLCSRHIEACFRLLLGLLPKLRELDLSVNSVSVLTLDMQPVDVFSEGEDKPLLGLRELRSLKISWNDFDSNWNAAPPGLSSLDIVCDYRGDHWWTKKREAVSTLRHFSQLERLSMPFWLIAYEAEFDGICNLDPLEILPPSLQILTIYNSDFVVLLYLARIIANQGHFPALCEVVIVSRVYSPAAFDEFQKSRVCVFRVSSKIVALACGIVVLCRK